MIDVVRARDTQEVLLSITISLHSIVGILSITVGVLIEHLRLILEVLYGIAWLGLSIVVPDDGLTCAEVLHIKRSTIFVLIGDGKEDLIMIAVLRQVLIERLALCILEGEEHAEESTALMSLEVMHILEAIIPRQSDLASATIV